MSRLLRSMRTSRALAAAVGASSLYRCSSSYLESEPVEKPTFSERTIGHYENRLRRFSSPERVFEYFSSVEIDGQFFMTRDDLARAVTPYTHRHGAPISSKNPKYNAKASADKTSKDVANEYLQRVQNLLIENKNVSKSDVEELLDFRNANQVSFETHVKTLRTLQLTNAEFEEFIKLNGGPQRSETFFEMVDADGDGLISYPEFMFFQVLLAIPERHFELAFKMFDTDDNGKLDQREFKQIMELMRMRTPAGRRDRSLYYQDVPIFKHLFGEHATKTLSYEEFCTFRRDLKREITVIQFEQFDVDGDRTLSPREFAMFLVSHVDQHHLDMWVDRVEKLQGLQGHVTEEEFINFSVFLEHLDELKVAMDFVMQDHGVNKEQFLRATKAAVRGSTNDKPVTPMQVDILFALFDLNDDGHLSTKEFIEVMQSCKNSGLNKHRDAGVLNFIGRVKECIKCMSD